MAPIPPKQQLDIAYYSELQRRVFDIFRYVSCHQNNFGAYSIIMESVLVDSGSFFDSLCQTFIRARSFDGHHFRQEACVKDFANKASRDDNFNCGDYRLLLDGEFALSGRSVNLNPYEDVFYANPTRYPPDSVAGYLVTPFQEWAAGKALPWWNAFTALKHDRLSNFRQATLGNVIHALAAVFIILTVHNEEEFKEGHLAPDIYDLFLPKYWQSKGRIFPGNIMWK